MGGSYIYVVLHTTMCTCTFMAKLDLCMFVVLHRFVVLHMCLCLEVYRYLKCDSCQYFPGMLIHFRFGENFGIKHSFLSYF